MTLLLHARFHFYGAVLWFNLQTLIVHPAREEAFFRVQTQDYSVHDLFPYISLGNSQEIRKPFAHNTSHHTTL